MTEPTENSIVAFDILPMSSTERLEGVKVAVSAKFRDGRVKEWSQVSRKKLLKIVKKHDFKYLGTDNPTEIIRENETIASFCDLLPPNSSFVHVNLTRSGSTVSVSSLFSQYGLNPTGKKLSPVKTARAIVNLIEKGVGMILEPYENETLIRVGKPSSSSKGGWSQARYQRQAEEVVGRESQRIRDLLIKSNLQFDEITHSTKYGSKMSRFHIFEGRNKVVDTLAGHSFYPAKVKIWSPKKSLITHRPLSTQSSILAIGSQSTYRRIIIGVDPGMTTGVAILSLKGKVISAFSRKNLSKGQLITEIAKFGIPVLVCADVSPIPTFVTKIASTYNSPIVSPEITLRKEDKRQLASELNYNQRLDSHERDALAAVSYAFKKLERNFTKIEQENLSGKQQEIAKSLIIRGLSLQESIESAKRHKKPEYVTPLEEKEYHERDVELVGRVNNLQDELQKSEDIIGNLRAHAGRVESQNTFLSNRLRFLEKKIADISEEQTRISLQDELVQDKERQLKLLARKLKSLEDKNKQQEDRIGDLEQMLWVTLDEGGLPVKIVPKFSNDAISKLKQDNQLDEGDLLLIIDPTGGGPQTAEKLVETRPGFIFIENHNFPEQAERVFFRAEIPIMRAENYGIVRTQHLGIINQKNLLKAKDDYNIAARRREESERTNKILQTIEDYKYERAKELEENKKTYDDFELVEEEINEEHSNNPHH